MAESSRFWTTGTTNDGASTYTAAQMQQFIRESFLTSPSTEGPLYGIGNNLAVSGTSSPVAVNTGAAIVYGFYYSNDASVSVAVSTPASSTRVDVVVLKVDWANNRVRIALHAGTEGAGVPSLTQVANTTWEIPLANVSITTGGVITVTDRRTFVKNPGVYGWLNAALTLNSTLTVGDNLTVSKSASGTYVESGVRNTSNTAGSYARHLSQVAGASADDPLFVWEISGVRAWAMGLDNSDSDKLKIAPFSVIGSGDVLTLDSSGNMSVAAAIAASGGITGTGEIRADGASAFQSFKNRNGANYWGWYATSNIARLTDSIGDMLTVDSSGNTVIAGALSASSLNASQLTTGTLPAARLPTDSVDDTIVGNRVLAFTRRQGGSATDWGSAGTTDYTPGAVRAQAGSTSMSFVSTTGNSASVIFPVAFAGGSVPLIFLTSQSFGDTSRYAPRLTYTASNSSVSITADFPFGVTGTLVVNWLAIGAE